MGWVFRLARSVGELEEWRQKRGQASAEVVAGRMAQSRSEISHWAGYDYVLVNDDLDKTEAQLKTIIEATRLRRLQQPWLNDHVRGLQSEFEETS